MEKLQVGPAGFEKIAIVGSAASSTLLAPFDDPSWSLWCCSPAVFAQVASRRSDVWFELHRWMPYSPGRSQDAGVRPWFSPEYTQFLASYKGPVFMTDVRSMKDPGTWEDLHARDGAVHASIPNSAPFPYEYLLRKHGPYHFSSTIAWMLALALEYQPKAIGLFGVDMAAGEEWAYQRPGCQHFIGLAKALGIAVVVPPESDLMRHSTLYGIGEHNHRHVKLRERLVQLEQQAAILTNAINQNSVSLHNTNGQIAMLKNVIEVWSDDLMPDDVMAMSYAGRHVAKPLNTIESLPQPLRGMLDGSEAP